MKRLVLALAVVALVGCKKAKQPAPKAAIAPTLAEADEFGKQIAAALAPCDTAKLDQMIDTDFILSRAIAGRPIGDEELRGIKRGLGTMGARLCRELAGQEGQKVVFLRSQMIGGSPRPLLRLTSGAGVNYYQFELDKQPSGIRAADILVYLSGETLSESMSTAFDALAKSGIGKATLTAIKTTRENMRDGKWTEARAQFETLPASLRKTKPLRLLELQIVGEIDNAEYLKVLDAYSRDFPNDPSLALVRIDQVILKKQWTELLAMLDQLDKLLGGDPYLDQMRVDAYINLGKHDEAIAAAQHATKAEPTAESAWWLLFASQVEAKKYADAITTLEMLRDTFGYVTWDGLAQDEQYATFVASPEFQAWLAKQAK